MHLSVPAPALSPIENEGNDNYVVNWQAPCPGQVFTYTLQEDGTPAFDTPRVHTASKLSDFVNGRISGTIYIDGIRFE